MRLLSFRSRGELYATDVSCAAKFARNIPITPVAAAPGFVVGIASIKGRVITVLDLGALMGVGGGDAATPGSRVNAMVLSPSPDGDQTALRIDGPGNLHEVDDGAILPIPVSAGASERRYIKGVAEIGGLLYRIVDARAVIRRDRAPELE
ncbi:MAG: chemotaxis protein CheW [Oscillospiraceae bacterium]|nr:chemotaxis protein CheW [Oscillospiraceae bacterium]